MRAVRTGVVAPERFELFEVELSPGPGQALIEIAACGICSSEIPRFHGRWEKEPPDFIGHEASGVVLEVGPGVTALMPGDRVAGDITPGFATHALADVDRLVAAPHTVPLEQVLGEPLMCTTNVARAAAPAFGDHVAVVGCGAMGLLTIAALRSNALGSLIAVDRVASRLELAAELGATHAVNPTEVDAVEAVVDLTGAGADVVVELTGVPGGLELAAELLRKGQGKLVMAGYHHSRDTYDLRGFADKGLIAHSAHPYYSLDWMADYRRAMAALERGVFPMDRVITHRFPLDRVGDGFQALIAHQEGYIKGVVTPAR